MLSLNFWFSMKGEMMLATRWLLIVVLLVMSGYILYYIANTVSLKKNSLRKVYRRLLGFSQTNLIFGLYLWFVMEQVVPVLSARVWLLFWFAEMFLWLASIYKHYKRVANSDTSELNNNKLKKYIP